LCIVYWAQSASGSQRTILAEDFYFVVYCCITNTRHVLIEDIAFILFTPLSFDKNPQEWLVTALWMAPPGVRRVTYKMAYSQGNTHQPGTMALLHVDFMRCLDFLTTWLLAPGTSISRFPGDT
jgi:hypothetical protein